MTEHNRRTEDIKIAQLESMVQTHHGKINVIEKTLAQTPDPKTLRDMEHKYRETPDADALKEVVKARGERSAMFKRVGWGIMATVFGTIALFVMSLIWQGMALAIQGAGK